MDDLTYGIAELAEKKMILSESLEQRMAQSYIDLFPPFVPKAGAPVSAEEQKALYDLMDRLYHLAFDEPQFFVSALHEDDVYPTRYKKAYGKPNLITDMRKFIKAVDALVEKMFLLGQKGAVTLTKREQGILKRLGTDDGNPLPAAWGWMAERGSLIAFKYCLFDENHLYTLDVYARLLGETGLKKLADWMFAKGYKPLEVHDINASDCKLSLSIYNPKWGKTLPKGGCEYGIKHTGIAMQYDFWCKTPVALGLCIPNGMRTYLEAFNEMDEGLKRFVASHTKKCDGCRYCVQTDKTGKRPLAYVPIQFEGESHHLCTYFPGYNYCWPNIDDALADELIRMLDFMDRFAPEGK